MQDALNKKSEIFSDWIFKIMLENDLDHIFLIDLKCIVSIIFYLEKYHFLLEPLSNEEKGTNEVQNDGHSYWPVWLEIIWKMKFPNFSESVPYELIW